MIEDNDVEIVPLINRRRAMSPDALAALEAARRVPCEFAVSRAEVEAVVIGVADQDTRDRVFAATLTDGNLRIYLSQRLIANGKLKTEIRSSDGGCS